MYINTTDPWCVYRELYLFIVCIQQRREYTTAESKKINLILVAGVNPLSLNYTNNN